MTITEKEVTLAKEAAKQTWLWVFNNNGSHPIYQKEKLDDNERITHPDDIWYFFNQFDMNNQLIFLTYLIKLWWGELASWYARETQKAMAEYGITD